MAPASGLRTTSLDYGGDGDDDEVENDNDDDDEDEVGVGDIENVCVD